MSKSVNFEKAFQRLEEIARLLETGDNSLEESLKLYEEGMKLVETCGSKLTEAEEKIMLLSKGKDGSLQTSPLPDTD